MESRTNAINSSLMIVGALILLAVLAWVVLTMSQPLVPNTGTATTTLGSETGVTTPVVDDSSLDMSPSSSDDLIDSVPDDHSETE